MSDKDVIDWPAHYNKGTIQPIDVIEDWNLPHHLACIVKYLARYQHKGTALNDLKKARWYLDRWIKITEMAGDGLLVNILSEKKNGTDKPAGKKGRPRKKATRRRVRGDTC